MTVNFFWLNDWCILSAFLRAKWCCVRSDYQCQWTHTLWLTKQLSQYLIISLWVSSLNYSKLHAQYNVWIVLVQVSLGGTEELRNLKSLYRAEASLPPVPDETIEVTKTMRAASPPASAADLIEAQQQRKNNRPFKRVCLHDMFRRIQRYSIYRGIMFKLGIFRAPCSCYQTEFSIKIGIQ